MEDKYLEKLLHEIGKEDVKFPVVLMESTKQKLDHRYFLSIISFSILLNIFSLIGLAFFIYLKFSFKGLISLYVFWSFISNLSILPVVILKNKAKLKPTMNGF